VNDKDEIHTADINFRDITIITKHGRVFELLLPERDDDTPQMDLLTPVAKPPAWRELPPVPINTQE